MINLLDIDMQYTKAVPPSHIIELVDSINKGGLDTPICNTLQKLSQGGVWERYTSIIIMLLKFLIFPCSVCTHINHFQYQVSIFEGYSA